MKIVTMIKIVMTGYDDNYDDDRMTIVWIVMQKIVMMIKIVVTMK